MEKFWIWIRCVLIGHSHNNKTNYRALENHPAGMYLWTCTRCGKRLATARLYGFDLSGGVTRPGETMPVDADTERWMIEKYAKEKR
jgi:hypothetical protein